MSGPTEPEEPGAAQARARLWEVIGRVSGGTRSGRPIGLAAVAGALADWDDLTAAVADVYASRRRARDRTRPDLD